MTKRHRRTRRDPLKRLARNLTICTVILITIVVVVGFNGPTFPLYLLGNHTIVQYKLGITQLTNK